MKQYTTASLGESPAAILYERHIGNFLTITLDRKVIESAVIQSEITGQGQIAGSNMTLADAQETAALLRYGALPVPLTVVSETTITT